MSSARRARSGRSCSAPRRRTSGPARRSFRAVLDGLLGGVDLDRFRDGLETPLATAVRRRAPPRRARAAAARRPRAAAARRADQPSRRRGDHLARRPSRRAPRARSSSSPTIAGSSTPCARRPGRSPTEAVHQYEGGYAAYVLARAERERQAAAREDRRRAAACARSSRGCGVGHRPAPSKPKFRIEAANALIADEPQARDRAELLRFASARLGDKVLDAVDVSLDVRRARGAARASPGGSGPATGWRSSAPTDRARRRCCGCSRVSCEPSAG